MVSETKFRENVLYILNKEKKTLWKVPKMGFQNKNKVKYKGINRSRSQIPVHTGLYLISKSSLNLLKPLLYYIFDFLNH